MMSIKLFLLYKIGKNKNLQSLLSGNVYFSCCGKYVSIARAGCGKGQGDKYECVFAKYLKKNSRKPIQHYKHIFGRDLIVESENDYILLRRKSSLLIPTTCYYSFDNSSIISVLSDEDKKYYGNNIHHDQNSQNAHIDNFPLNVPDIYREEFFIESDEIEAMIIQPKKFTDCLIKQGVSIHKIEYINTNREYDIFRDNTYKNIFGNITEEDAISRRADLFFKDKNNYAHQNELRCIIPSIVFKNFSNHITLHINNLKTGILEHIPYNATEYDMIYGVKNLVAAGRIKLSTV